MRAVIHSVVLPKRNIGTQSRTSNVKVVLVALAQCHAHRSIKLVPPDLTTAFTITSTIMKVLKEIA